MGKFTCGHSGDDPRNMGRGGARERRLAEYYGTACFDCRLSSAVASAHRLTDIRGVPLSGQALEQAVQRARQRVRP